MSSSFHSTGDTPAQRVPAWKRLGLKLKPASEAQSQDATLHPTTTTSTAPATSLVPNNRAPFGGSTPNAKRKASGGAPALDHSTKRAKRDNWQDHTASHQTKQTLKKAKSVTFSADTAEPRSPAAKVNGAAVAKSKKQKQTSTKDAPPAPTKPTKKSAPVNLEPALAYLRTWHTSRETWKFNKNHQTKLLEQVFADADETTIPAADISVFYEYIRGLQGSVRTRLRELANGIKAQDMEQGASGFAAANKKEMAERKQKEYEEVINAFLGQARTPEKRRFNEVDYVLRTTDMEMQRRVVKRMRAEMVLDELSEGDDSETTETTATTTSAESASTEKGGSAEKTGGQVAVDGDKRLKLNEGSQQRVKRKRKLRTAAVEDDTSSESESESESGSDTSSSGSSSSSSSSSEESDDDDDEPAVGPRRNEVETSSSSSSSSSESESGSDNEEDDSDEDED
ncbi:hypothetical protein F5Y19DRAFT_241903 [Xylariaceae sp. FL1651]|nr:hypothetical protein F5Y19DRAFT_241903 [Xylariaceae sp. FL1651]